MLKQVTETYSMCSTKLHVMVLHADVRRAHYNHILHSCTYVVYLQLAAVMIVAVLNVNICSVHSG
jgi:hypothetical protein